MDSDAVIAILIFGGFVIGLIWAIFAQIRQKKTEQFEKRDN